MFHTLDLILISAYEVEQLLHSCYRCRSWSTERLNNLSEVTQLVSGRAGIQTQTGRLQSPSSEPLGNLVTNGACGLRGSRSTVNK